MVCVGRIEPRKNQLGLIRALANTSIELTLVGQPGRFHERYARACHAAATANMNFIEWQDSHSLREIYAEARVHACPSWYETPGLVNLEAAACGCRLAVTSRGSTREHFGDEAEYCDPGDPDSIRNSVEKALARGPSLELAHRLGREYTWTAAAESTRKAYDQVLSATRKSQPNASDE